jgi:asparagine synthase (glutamine-hydrolysing)
MSAIAGFVRFDGGPVDRDILSRMAARMVLRGYDLTTAVDHDAGLIFGTIGRDLLPQPVSDRAGEALAVFDGRLDNRAELIASLGVADASDASLVLAAYRKWGAAFPEHLLGDFALAIADRRARQVICARDPFGLRRLHYRVGAGWIAFASSVDSLIAAIAPMPAINEGMVGEQLASFVVTESETLYDNVFRLPAAHTLVASAGSQRSHRYWQPSPAVLRYTNDREYEEHLRDLMTRAVAACLRTTSPAGVMLSGGLDSSSITGLAATLVRDRAVPAASLETFSSLAGGEREFFSLVNDRWGLTSHPTPHARPQPGQLRNEMAIDLEPQLFPHTPSMDLLRAEARGRGVRVLMTGIGGDEWLGTAAAALADLLRQGRLASLLRRLYLDRGEDHDPGWRETLRATVWPLLPAPLQDVARQLLRRGQPPRWIAPEFARRIDLADRMAQYRPARRFATHEQDSNWFDGMNGWRMFVIENVTRGADRFGLDLAHPFCNRPLVEFCLALPADQLWRNGRPKDLLRRTMRDLVPAEVAARRSSPSGDDAFLDLLSVEAGPTPFADLEVERRGWIDGAVARAMHAGLPAASPFQQGSDGRILWGIQAIDAWLGVRNMVK